MKGPSMPMASASSHDAERNLVKTHFIDALAMKAGDGEFSYVKNSALQRNAMYKAQHVLSETVQEMLSNMSCLPSCFRVADMGCSTGPNTVLAISKIMSIVCEMYQQRGQDIPEFDVRLNDLPENDFNTTFKIVLDSIKNIGENRELCLVSGVPGSFYSRLFPTKSLHFLHSSYSLHFLSKVPDGLDENKGDVYMGRLSPQSVYSAYAKHYERDFWEFLRLRSREMVQGGRMVLTFIGRSVADPSAIDCCHFWVLLTDALLDLVAKGLVREADIDSFNVPFYGPCEEEVTTIVRNEGSFTLGKLETFEFHLGSSSQNCSVQQAGIKPGNVEANCVRAATEAILVAHFGEGIIEPLFERYAELWAEHVCSVASKTTVNIVISLTKI